MKRAIIKLSVIVLLLFLFSCGSVFGVVVDITSTQEGFDVEPLTTYDLLLDGMLSPVSDGLLAVTEHWVDLNNGFTVGTMLAEYVNIDIDGIVLDIDGDTDIVYADDNMPISRTLVVSFILTAAQMVTIAADGQAVVHVTTSAGVDKSLEGSWFQANISYEAVPEPGTMVLVGLGGLALRKRRAHPLG